VLCCVAEYSIRFSKEAKEYAKQQKQKKDAQVHQIREYVKELVHFHYPACVLCVCVCVWLIHWLRIDTTHYTPTRHMHLTHDTGRCGCTASERPQRRR
jgi:hypothetical protein